MLLRRAFPNLFNFNIYLSGRLGRILTMVYVVQNYWAYFGLYPSSGIWQSFLYYFLRKYFNFLNYHMKVKCIK
jgi:hypothetical protein